MHIIEDEEDLDINYQPIVEECIYNTNLIVNRWKESESVLTGRKIINTNDIESVFYHNIRKHLFCKESKDFNLLRHRIMLATDENYLIQGIWSLEEEFNLYNRPYKIQKLFNIFKNIKYDDFLITETEGLETEAKTYETQGI